MKFSSYLKDKMYIILIFISLNIFMFSSLNIFKVNIFINIYILIMFIASFLFVLIYEYIKRKTFYNNILNNMENLDKKYLIQEIIGNSSFLEGRILKDILYDIDKSYIDNLNIYKVNINDFKDYIEMWLHEVKTPISSAKLIVENNKNDVTNSLNEEIDKIDNLTEQVMFYLRSEIVEKDYIIKNINLKEVIDKVITKNKKQLIAKKFKININTNNSIVKSDIKWLEYIIDQIILNIVKYSNINPIIDITAIKNLNDITLNITDNGIGINSSDILRVFDKGFTGSNGRKKYKSTGLGLYICKNLCNKLNHNILISSKEKEYTTVSIIFPNNSYSKIEK